MGNNRRGTINKFLKKGKEVEKNFKSSLNLSCENASFDEDTAEHWDLKLTLKFDVKGLKKIRREDEDVNEHYHWIEIKGDTGPGWLFGGEADFIAFEVKSYFIVVEREVLKDFVTEKCKEKIWTTKRGEVYKLYKRPDRPKEVLTFVKTEDLCYLSTLMIEKQ